MRSLHVTVMLGGPSAEREVSLRSGGAVVQALRALGHAVEALDPVTDDWQLSPGTEVVFLALHGTYGEDGTVQQRLESMRMPFTGCGSAVSRLAFDKVETKRRCESAGVPTPRYLTVAEADTPWPSGWRPPVVVKPVRQGSSVGLSMVDGVDAWSAALRKALQLDGAALVEERIQGRETTVGILEGRALPVVEVRPRQGAYDYQNKYTPGATDYLCPAPFDGPTTARIQAAGLGAFAAIGGGDYARVDVMVDGSGQPWVLEVNTLPGMTETSLLPKAAAAAGLGFGALCERMLELALRRWALD